MRLKGVLFMIFLEAWAIGLVMISCYGGGRRALFRITALVYQLNGCILGSCVRGSFHSPINHYRCFLPSKILYVIPKQRSSVYHSPIFLSYGGGDYASSGRCVFVGLPGFFGVAIGSPENLADLFRWRLMFRVPPTIFFCIIARCRSIFVLTPIGPNRWKPFEPPSSCAVRYVLGCGFMSFSMASGSRAKTLGAANVSSVGFCGSSERVHRWRREV